MRIAIFIFLLISVKGFSQSKFPIKRFSQQYVLISANIESCLGGTESYSFDGYDQNCFDEDGVQICRQLYLTLEGINKYTFAGMLFYPEENQMMKGISEHGTVQGLNTPILSRIGNTQNKVTFCDIEGNNCELFDFRYVGKSIIIKDFSGCIGDMTFTPYIGRPGKLELVDD